MTRPVSDLPKMLASLDPVLSDQPYCFVLVTPDHAPGLLGQAISTFRETEGVTAIVPSALAQELEIAWHRNLRILPCEFIPIWKESGLRPRWRPRWRSAQLPATWLRHSTTIMCSFHGTSGMWL